MAKRIIVEGPDGSGKSTLIKSIVDRYGGAVKPVAGFKNQHYHADYPTWLAEQLNDIGPVVPVHDRFFYSELVYSKALRGSKTDLSKEVINSVKAMLRSSAFLIYCTLTYEKLVEEVTKTQQMEGVIENMRRIYMEYREVMGDEAARYYIHHRYFAYDWTYGRNTALFKLLDDYMRARD